MRFKKAGSSVVDLERQVINILMIGNYRRKWKLGDRLGFFDHGVDFADFRIGQELRNRGWSSRVLYCRVGSNAEDCRASAWSQRQLSIAFASACDGDHQPGSSRIVGAAPFCQAGRAGTHYVEAAPASWRSPETACIGATGPLQRLGFRAHHRSAPQLCVHWKTAPLSALWQHAI